MSAISTISGIYNFPPILADHTAGEAAQTDGGLVDPGITLPSLNYIHKSKGKHQNEFVEWLKENIFGGLVEKGFLAYIFYELLEGWNLKGKVVGIGLGFALGSLLHKLGGFIEEFLIEKIDHRKKHTEEDECIDWSIGRMLGRTFSAFILATIGVAKKAGLYKLSMHDSNKDGTATEMLKLLRIENPRKAREPFDFGMQKAIDSLHFIADRAGVSTGGMTFDPHTTPNLLESAEKLKVMCIGIREQIMKSTSLHPAQKYFYGGLTMGTKVMNDLFRYPAWLNSLNGKAKIGTAGLIFKDFAPKIAGLTLMTLGIEYLVHFFRQPVVKKLEETFHEYNYI
ncbi:MAG: hypothetical protein SFT81_00030 [Candidatus Caenarcaniphilales bacterium]|nr:hypothetical protein [Candidatus Caenarcaniphilales bacterium]